MRIIVNAKSTPTNIMTENRRQMWKSLPLLIIGLSAMSFVFYSVVKEHKRTKKIDLEIARQEQIAGDIAQENAVLEKTITYLESEDAQKFNAQKLGYQEEDHNVASVRDVARTQERILAQIDEEESQGLENIQLAERSNWKQWIAVFFE